MPRELKPCPFCGKSALVLPTYKFHIEKTRYIVKCSKCNAIMEYRDEKSAIEAWNRRVDNA